jgi:hypothetical protein
MLFLVHCSFLYQCSVVCCYLQIKQMESCFHNMLNLNIGYTVKGLLNLFLTLMKWLQYLVTIDISFNSLSFDNLMVQINKVDFVILIPGYFFVERSRLSRRQPNNQQTCKVNSEPFAREYEIFSSDAI